MENNNQTPENNIKNRFLGTLASLGMIVLGLFIVLLVNKFSINTKSETALLDADGDSYYTVVKDGKEKDCDDTDKTIYPQAKEIEGDGIDQDCNGEDAPLSFDPNQISDKFKEFQEFINLKKINIYKNTISPTSISPQTVVAFSHQIKTTGKFEKAYLYVNASIGDSGDPLTQYDSVYFYFNRGDTGGHLLRSQTFAVDTKTTTTQLLFDGASIPTINLPYTDKPEERRVKKLNFTEALNNESINKSLYIGSFVATNKFGRLLDLQIAYKCQTGTVCSIDLIK